jgi:dihydrolipoamide dehydrogenase
MGDEKKKHCDVTIIGGGAGGYTAALEAVRKGFSVNLIEKERVGGTCLNRGCVPTQCLLRDLIEYSVFKNRDYIEKDPEAIRLNIQKIMERKNQVVDLLVSGTENTLLSQGVTIIHGAAAFLDPQTVIIQPSEQVIQSKCVMIATGSRWTLEPPLAFDHEHVWDTSDALRMETVPKSIAILGEETRAMTFADIFHYLGSKVHVITQSAHILPEMDRGITSRYRKVLKEKRIDLFTNTTVTRVETGSKEDSIDLTLEGKKGTMSLRVAKVLVPADREANVEGLNLDRIGLSLRDGLIPVGPEMMTPIPGIYAIGDVVGGKYAAHKAMAEGVTAARRLAGETPRINYDLIPVCLYTNPEVASIGLAQEEAEKRGYEIEVGYSAFAAGARPAVFDQAEGIIKIVFEKKHGEVLGVHIMGPQATELITLASMAMKSELSLKEIKEVIYPHPSFSESFLEAVNDAIGAMMPSHASEGV